jgi:hypothetical protein
MAIRAELADGTVLEFPDGTDPQVIQNTVKNLIARNQQSTQEAEQQKLESFSQASEQELLDAFGKGELSVEQLQQIDRQQRVADVGPLESLGLSFGKGFTTIKRALGLQDMETEEERLTFEELQKQRPISSTIGEVLGETAPFVAPAIATGGVAGLGGRIATSGALGATEAGLIARGKGGDEGEQLKAAGLGGALAGGLEVAIPVLGRVVGKTYRSLTGRQPKGPLLTSDGRPTREFVEALDKAGLSFDDVAGETKRIIDTGNIDDAAQVSRKVFLESQGITPTRAQVTGEATDFQSQQELIKQSGGVRDLLQAQEGVIASKFDNAIVATGGSANPSSSQVFDTIADRAIDQDAAISAAYKTAREQAGNAQIVRPSKMVEEMRSFAGSDKATGGLASAARDILRNKGVLAQGKGLKIQGKVNPQVAEEIRIDLNSLYDSLTPFGRSKLSDLKNAIDLDVQNAVGKDVFAEARGMKAKFEKDLRRAKVNKFDKRKGNLVRDILENKINPDNFLQDAVITKRVRSSDLEQLKRYLQQSDEGVDSWNSLRADAMTFIRDNALKEVGGEVAMTRASLEKALDKFGRDKLRVLFDQGERKFLQDMVKVSKLREPARGTALGKGPSAQAVRELEKAVNRNSLINAVWAGGAELIKDRSALKQIKPSAETPLKPSQLSQLAAPAAAVTVTQEQ